MELSNIYFGSICDTQNTKFSHAEFFSCTDFLRAFCFKNLEIYIYNETGNNYGGSICHCHRICYMAYVMQVVQLLETTEMETNKA